MQGMGPAWNGRCHWLNSWSPGSHQAVARVSGGYGPPAGGTLCSATELCNREAVMKRPWKLLRLFEWQRGCMPAMGPWALHRQEAGYQEARWAGRRSSLQDKAQALGHSGRKVTLAPPNAGTALHLSVDLTGRLAGGCAGMQATPC